MLYAVDVLRMLSASYFKDSLCFTNLCSCNIQELMEKVCQEVELMANRVSLACVSRKLQETSTPITVRIRGRKRSFTKLKIFVV